MEKLLCQPYSSAVETGNVKGDTVITLADLRVGQIVSPVIEKFEVLVIEPSEDSTKVTVRYIDDGKEAVILLGAGTEFFVLDEGGYDLVETEDDIENEFMVGDDYPSESNPRFEFVGDDIYYDYED